MFGDPLSFDKLKKEFSKEFNCLKNGIYKISPELAEDFEIIARITVNDFSVTSSTFIGTLNKIILYNLTNNEKIKIFADKKNLNSSNISLFFIKKINNNYLFVSELGVFLYNDKCKIISAVGYNKDVIMKAKLNGNKIITEEFDKKTYEILLKDNKLSYKK